MFGRNNDLRWMWIVAGFLLLGGGYGRSALAQNWVETGYKRDVNRYLWTSEAKIGLNVGSWHLDAQNMFRSDAFLLFDDRLSFRDEDRFQFRAARPARGSLVDMVVHGRAEWFSLSRVFRQNTWVGIRYGKDRSFWVEPAVGLALDSRPGFGQNPADAPVRSDVGPGFGVEFGLPLRSISGYQVEVLGRAQVEQTSPRLNRLLRTEGSANRQFDNTSVRTRVRASSVRRDAYQSASFLNRDDNVIRPSETVESTRSDTVNAFLEVETRVAPPLWISGSIDVSTNSRAVETLRAPGDALFFDSNFNRRTVEGSLVARLERNTTRFRLSAIAGAEVERRRLDNAADLPAAQAAQKLSLLRQADNDRGYLTIQQSLITSLRPWWQLQADASANILRHNTPNVNPDDRDELLYNAQIGSRFRIREGLEFSAQVLGSWFHTVYIKSSRSAENTVQRSLRYRPSVEWRPSSRSRIRIGSEVRATYTVDDFLLPGRRPTDQSARELRHEIEVEQTSASGLRLLLDGRYSDLRLGRFLKDTFAEIPFDTLKTYSGWARVQTGGKFQAEVGLRFFIRTDFDRSASVRYTVPETGQESTISRTGRIRIDQIGPTTAISWYMRRDALLRIEGWAVFQRVSHTLYGSLPEGLEQVILKAASAGRTSVIPNLTVSMRWSW